MTHYAGDAVLAMANGGCYRCRRGDELVDFDVHIEGEGSLALCRSCVGDGAQAAGLVFNRAVVSELTTRLEETEARLKEARAREQAFQSALEAALAVAADDDEPEPAVDRCTAVKKNGERCKGQATTDAGTCNFHA